MAKLLCFKSNNVFDCVYCQAIFVLIKNSLEDFLLKFMFSEKATQIDEIFTVNLTLCKCQIDCEDFVNFCGLPRKHELYKLKAKFSAR